MTRGNLNGGLSDFEGRLASVEPHLRYLVARVIQAVLAVDDAGADTDARLRALLGLVELGETVDWAVRMEILGLRSFTDWDVSWTDIGDVLGISRQAARQRFRMGGSLGKADADAERHERTLEAKRNVVLAQLKADMAELQVEKAAGDLDDAAFSQATERLQRTALERLMAVSDDGALDRTTLIAKQEWYRAAELRNEEEG